MGGHYEVPSFEEGAVRRCVSLLGFLEKPGGMVVEEERRRRRRRRESPSDKDWEPLRVGIKVKAGFNGVIKNEIIFFCLR